MPPENLRFGGGASETILHPIVLVAMLIAMVLIFVLPRKHIIWPFLLSAFLIPLGQSILVGGLHFFVIRIIILTVVVRMLVSRLTSPEAIFGDRLGTFDTLFLIWAFCRALAGALVFSFNSGALIYQGGFLLDAIGGFFVLRYLIADDEDIYRTVRVFAIICMVVGGCMLFERVHQLNVFGLLGGVRTVPEVRNGSVRAEGPFQHELLAGTFAATLVPLFFLLWRRDKSRLLAACGIIAATVMVITSHSSTSVMAYAAGVVGLCAWPLRKHMRLVRWVVVLGLISLHLVMKAPVWFLIMRIDIVGGSSGYHRAMLVNDFITHFNEWWLVGTTENARWGATMWDLCNQYVAEGQLGGLASFLCFLGLIYMCFSRIGTARASVQGDRSKEWYFWIFGATLFSHVIGFFGISYFDQTRVSWFALLVMIITTTAPYVVKAPVKHFGRTPLRAPKPAYASASSRLRLKPGVPARDRSRLETRFS